MGAGYRYNFNSPSDDAYGGTLSGGAAQRRDEGTAQPWVPPPPPQAPTTRLPVPISPFAPPSVLPFTGRLTSAMGGGAAGGIGGGGGGGGGGAGEMGARGVYSTTAAHASTADPTANPAPHRMHPADVHHATTPYPADVHHATIPYRYLTTLNGEFDGPAPSASVTARASNVAPAGTATARYQYGTSAAPTPGYDGTPLASAPAASADPFSPFPYASAAMDRLMTRSGTGPATVSAASTTGGRVGTLASASADTSAPMHTAAAMQSSSMPALSAALSRARAAAAVPPPSSRYTPSPGEGFSGRRSYNYNSSSVGAVLGAPVGGGSSVNPSMNSSLANALGIGIEPGPLASAARGGATIDPLGGSIDPFAEYKLGGSAGALRSGMGAAATAAASGRGTAGDRQDYSSRAAQWTGGGGAGGAGGGSGNSRGPTHTYATPYVRGSTSSMSRGGMSALGAASSRGASSHRTYSTAEQLHKDHSQRLQQLQEQYEQLQTMFKQPE
jgi:hypothetical protein